MTLNDYQKAAERTSGDLTSWDKVRNGCYGLNGEAGECIDILKKTEFQGHAFDPMKMVDELGDVLWYVAQLATGLGVTTPKQFVGYNEENPADDGLITLCIDVLTRWYAEREGQVEVGRVLPADYLWFSGDGERNHFRNAYRGGDRWDWSLPSPYES